MGKHVAFRICVCLQAANLLCALEMILLLLARNPELEPSQDTNLSTNQTLLGQVLTGHTARIPGSVPHCSSSC